MDKNEKLPVKTEKSKVVSAGGVSWHPFEDLRREVDRLFDEVGRGGWLRPFRTVDFGAMSNGVMVGSPAVDIVEHDRAFEITAELPGFEARNVEVTLRNGNIVIKGEKREEKEEKSKDYYLKERQYGTFERSFAVPESVDAGKVAATFKNGVLTVTLPKSAAAQKPEQKVEVKAT